MDKKLEHMSSKDIYDLAIANQIVEDLINQAVLANPYKSEFTINYRGYMIVARKENTHIVATHNLIGHEKKHAFTITD